MKYMDIVPIKRNKNKYKRSAITKLTKRIKAISPKRVATVGITIFALVFGYSFPGLSLVNAATIPDNKVQTSMFGFVLAGTYSKPGGIPTGTGQIKNGNVGAYPEGACIPIEVEVKNNDNVDGDILVSPVFDYDDGAGNVGLSNLEVITTALSGNPRSSVDNLNDFSYPGSSLASATSFVTSGGSVSASVTGPFAGNSAGTSAVSASDSFRHYNVLLSNVPSKATVYLILCARLGVDASLYNNGAALSVRLAQGGNENVPIPVNQLLTLPSLTLTKIVDGGNATPDQWSFNVSPSINNQSEFAIPNGESSVVIDNIPADGDYTITENGPQEYSFTNGDGTNCAFVSSTATASVAA